MIFVKSLCKNKPAIALCCIFFLFMMFSIPQINAFEFDNIKGELEKGDGISEYGKIEIRNSIFGIPWLQLDKVSEIELKENTERCDGIHCYARKEITMYENGKLIDDVRFKTINGKDILFNNYKIKIKQDGKWGDYNYKEVAGDSKGIKYEVKLEGKLNSFGAVDWQIKSQGIWIEDWAVWTSSFGNGNGLLYYYGFEEGTGTFAQDNATGNNLSMSGIQWIPSPINGQALVMDDNADKAIQGMNVSASLDSNKNRSINLWANVTTTLDYALVSWGTDAGDNALWTFGSGSAGYFVNIDSGSVFGLNDTASINDLQMLTITKNDTNWQLYVDGVFLNNTAGSIIPSSATNRTNISIGDSPAFPFQGVMDEIGIWNRTLTASEIIDLYNNGNGIFFRDSFEPIVSLNSPADNDIFISQTVNLNCSAEGTDVLNISLFVDLVEQATVSNTSANQEFLELTFQDTGLSDADHNWTCNSTDLQLRTGVITDNNFSIKRNLFVEQSQTFDNETLELSSDTFEINFSYNDNFYTSVDANLFYNNSKNTGAVKTEIESSGNIANVSFSKSIVIPAVTVEINNSVYWEIALTNITGTFLFNSSFLNQTVLNFNIDNCSLFDTTILEYLVKDEETQDDIPASNVTVEIDLSISSLIDATQSTNFSFIENGTNPVRVCLSENLTLTAKHSLNVETRYFADNKVIEFHNIQNFSLTNISTPQNISLFDLNISDSTEFLITFKGDDFLPVENALIDITRKYVGEGLFKSVEIPKTDANGQTRGHFDVDGVIYTLIVTKEGAILATFANQVVVCENAIIGDCRINLNAGAVGDAFSEFSEVGGIIYDMSFDEDLRRITTTFTTTDGSSKIILVNSTKYDMFGNQSVCSDTVTSSSGTLICDVPASFGNLSIITQLISDGNPVTTRSFSISPNPRDTFGADGLLMVLILMITLPLIAITDKIGMIVMTFIGLIFMGLLLVFESGSILGPTSAVVWFIIAGGILIWKISKTG